MAKVVATTVPPFKHEHALEIFLCFREHADAKVGKPVVAVLVDCV